MVLGKKSAKPNSTKTKKIFGIIKRENTPGINMNWKELTQADQLDTIKKESEQTPVLIFKHSTRCSVSSMALNRLERSWSPEDFDGLKLYFLDLISNRHISNQIAEDFEVPHESPQILIISDGKCIYNNSHMGISYHEVKRIFDSFMPA
jgi:bacillithiol system protein YtxJ